MPDRLVLDAPAKLNLSLDVTGVALNGYHTLDMIMHTISLCDTVVLEPFEEIELVCPAWLPGGPGNLAWRAAARLREAAGTGLGARITLEKRIPAQAGLGGGSADAAAVLKGLNKLWELHMDQRELCRIGLSLGSDVPFAVAGGTARVRGVGELLEPVGGAPSFWFLLAKPAGGVGTADAYRLWDAVGASHRPDTLRFLDAFLTGDIGGMARFGGNALEKAAVQLLPPVGVLMNQMKTTGAGYSAMTGSGAAVFGVFETERDALLAQGKLAGAHWSAVACSLPAAPAVR